jgi:hypothetical protein
VTPVNHWVGVNETQLTDTFSEIERAYAHDDNTFGMVLFVVAFVIVMALFARGYH